jgi:hypothetical protein
MFNEAIFDPTIWPKCSFQTVITCVHEKPSPPEMLAQEIALAFVKLLLPPRQSRGIS